MKTPRASAREAHMRTTCAWGFHAHGGKKPQNSIPKGAGWVPQFFFSPQILFFFVTINSMQNFKTVAQPLLGEKFVWWWWWWVVEGKFSVTLWSKP